MEIYIAIEEKIREMRDSFAYLHVLVEIYKAIVGNVRKVLHFFWSEQVWLPPNVTWADIAPGPDKAVNYNDHTHLWYPIPVALALLILRSIVKEKVLEPIASGLHISSRRSYDPPNYPELRAAYRRLGAPNYAELARSNDMSVDEVKTWFRLRRRHDSHPPRAKYCESMWRLILYVSNFLLGLYVLWDKAWLWDIDQCYVGYPHHGITNDVWWYYMVSSALYWSLMISLWDNRFVDWQMILHHIATLALLTFSWVCNLHRIGTLVLLCHGIADIFIQAWKATKLAKYFNNLRITLFLVLVVTWLTTRVGIYPFYIIWSTWIRAPQILPLFPAYYIFNALLCCLLALNVAWTWPVLVNPIRGKKVPVEDGRSSRKKKLSFRNTPSIPKTIWDGLSMQANVNKYVDKAISQHVPFMKAYSLDPMDLPDVDEGNEFRLKIHDGSMRGLANVSRSGDQCIKYTDNKLSIRLQFQFTKLEIAYKYMLLVMNVGPNGEIEGSLDRLTIGFDLLIDFNNEKLLLQEFSISDISELRVQLTGNFLIDRFVNPISQLFTNMFHKTIIDVVQSNIASAIQDALDFANTNVKDIIQSMVLYTVFEYKQVTNIMGDRYAEWRRQRSSKTSENQEHQKSK